MKDMDVTGWCGPNLFSRRDKAEREKEEAWLSFRTRGEHLSIVCENGAERERRWRAVNFGPFMQLFVRSICSAPHIKPCSCLFHFLFSRNDTIKGYKFSVYSVLSPSQPTPRETPLDLVGDALFLVDRTHYK